MGLGAPPGGDQLVLVQEQLPGHTHVVEALDSRNLWEPVLMSEIDPMLSLSPHG